MERRYTQRASVILSSAEGKTMEEIVEAIALSRPVVNKWRHRFKRYGMEGLQDAVRSGKPVVINGVVGMVGFRVIKALGALYDFLLAL